MSDPLLDRQYASTGQIAEGIRSYFDPQSTLEQQKESLDRLTHSIFQMEVRYISMLVANNTRVGLDIELMANDVTLEFLDRYLFCQGCETKARTKVEQLLKKMARSIVKNAFRDSRRWCRNPEQHRGDGARVVCTEWIESVEDTRSSCLPSDPIEHDELISVLESILSDPNLKPVYRLLICGFVTSEIASKLNWDQRTAERLVAQIRKELRPWCESNLSLSQDPTPNTQHPTPNTQHDLARYRDFSLGFVQGDGFRFLKPCRLRRDEMNNHKERKLSLKIPKINVGSDRYKVLLGL